MSFKKVAIFSVFFCCLGAENISFENVTIHGYSAFTHKFEKKIVSSNNLKEELPNSVFDAIEMKDQNIPILYENCIKDIAFLDQLILEKDGIMEIQPGAMKNLPLLRLIKLKQNKLKTIKTGVFNSLPVGDIDLTENDISNIEKDAFSNMEHLLNIKMAHNKIKVWNNNWFENTPLLRSVLFQHNLIAELPPASFKNMRGEKKFGKVPLTINLIFSYNKIESLYSDTFEGLEKINYLVLDNNLIDEIPKGMLHDVTVRNLMIGSNKLRCFEDVGAVLKAEWNDIDSNPFDCDCLKEIEKWAAKENKTVSLSVTDFNCYMNKMEIKIRSLEERLKEIMKERLEENN